MSAWQYTRDIFLADKIWILPQKINILLYLWQQKIFEDRIRIQIYLFDKEKTIKCIWIFSGGNNLILDLAYLCEIQLLRQLNSDSFHNFLKLKLMMTRMPTPRNWWWLAFSLSLQRKKNSEWTLNKFQTLLFLLPHITGYSFVTFMISARCTGGLP